jgi:hypothetical protein
MTWIGLDIGGANLKVADGHGYAHSEPFPLWRQPDRLPDALKKLLASAATELRVESDHLQLAVTMTGELADCFLTKAEGVRAIVRAAEQAAAGRSMQVYLTDGRFVPAADALGETLLAAASNWHALARFACPYCRGEHGLLIDIGSTTCDIIPLGKISTDFLPVAMGRTDPERLVAGELVYTGVQRSGVHGVVRELPWRGAMCPVAQEHFATTADAYVLLEEISEEAGNRDTADGRPRTKEFAQARLARTLCADTTLFSQADALRAARVVRDAQLDQLEEAVRHVLSRSVPPPTVVVLSGEGEFLARHLLDRLSWDGAMVSLAAELGDLTSRCGPAHALAVLARERQAWRQNKIFGGWNRPGCVPSRWQSP